MTGPLARAEPCNSDEVIAQVREISELMGLGQWVLGQTEHDCATRWNVSIVVVRRRAAEARRLVAHAYGDTDDLRARILVQLDGIASETRKREPRTAVSALQAMAAITGLVMTGRGNSAPERPRSKLSPAERLVEIARIQAQLDEAANEARAELGTLDVPVLSDGTPDPST